MILPRAPRSQTPPTLQRLPFGIALGVLFAACSADTGNPADIVRRDDTDPSQAHADADGSAVDAGVATAAAASDASAAASDAAASDAAASDAAASDAAAGDRDAATVPVDANGATAADSSAQSASEQTASETDDAVPPLDAAPSNTSTADDETQPAVPAYECSAAHYVFAPDIVNARDLGGVPLEDGATSCGKVFRGPPLAALTTERCAEFESLKIRTVIDLRVETERTAKPDAPCVTDKANIVLAPLPIPYEVSPGNYVTDLNTVDSMSAIFRTLGDPAAYPVYMHCTFGRDRTGVVAAAVLLALGASSEAIHAEYVLSADSVGAYPESLQGVLDEIEGRGGVDVYLADLGITEAQVGVLRERLSGSGN